MTEQYGIQAVDAWGIAPWDPNLILPQSWIAEEYPPEERGQFFVIHCGTSDAADYVCDLLNGEVES